MYKKRIRLLLWIFVAIFSLLIIRLAYLQIIEGHKYSGISDKRRIRTRPLDAVRGKVFDRNGILLAADKHSFNISVEYKDILYYYLEAKGEWLPRLSGIKSHQGGVKTCNNCHGLQQGLFNMLSKFLELDKDELVERAEKVVKRVETIKEDVSKMKGREMRILEETLLHPVATDVKFDKVAAIELYKEKFPGLSVEIKPIRWYPKGKLASHILGYTSEINDEEWKGYRFKEAGFSNNEIQVDAPLKLQSSIPDHQSEWESSSDIFDDLSVKRLNIERMFSLDHFSNISVGKTGIEAYYNMWLLGSPGERFEEVTCENSIVNRIIIERPPRSGENLFLTLDSRIQAIAEEALGARPGSIIVMDPWDGAIIAMASYPDFDPNTFLTDFERLVNDRRKPLLNRPIQSALPPGSVFKVVTAAAALTDGKLSNDTLIECYGSLRSDQSSFRCYSKYGHGRLNLEGALEHSCNAFFFGAAKELGGDLLYEWGKRLGFGQRAGIDLPYERKGLLPEPKSIAEAKNVSIGQGDMLATPLQITRMMAIIANGGMDIRPHLLNKIADDSGRILAEPNYIIMTKVGESLVPREVVKIIKQGLIKVVASGTAKDIGIDRYLVAGKTGTAETELKDDNHAWFTGFAPYDHPKYCFTVLIEHTPQHAAEATREVLRKFLSGLFPEVVSEGLESERY